MNETKSGKAVKLVPCAQTACLVPIGSLPDRWKAIIGPKDLSLLKSSAQHDIDSMANRAGSLAPPTPSLGYDTTLPSTDRPLVALPSLL